MQTNYPGYLEDKDQVMTEGQFHLIKELVLKEFGFVLKGDKRLTLHTRLSHRLKILGLASYTEYYNYIVNDRTNAEIYNLMAHITNNETYFMREQSQLNVFTSLLPEVKRVHQKQGEQKINILSAGCSSGEEVYTLNILLMESGLFVWGWETKITGMDISKTALKRAESCNFTKNSFRMLNGCDEFTKKYFDSDNESFALKLAYRRNTDFRLANIVSPDSFVGLKELDFIFCRNILIYMDDPAIEKIARNFYNSLADHGYLILGSSESMLQKTELFIPESEGGIIIYRKNPLASPAMTEER